MQIEECNENEFIKNLTYIKTNNEIQLKWEWPELTTGIDYVYIFEIEKEDETLFELVKRNAKHFSVSRKNYIEKGFYSKIMLNDNIRFKIFPIKMNSSNTIVLNQTSNNTTKTFYKSTIVEYSITTKSSGSKKRIQFSFSNIDVIRNISECEIVYHKYNKDEKYICTYPLNIDLILKGDYNILINSKEQVKLGLKDKESDIIKFRLR